MDYLQINVPDQIKSRMSGMRHAHKVCAFTLVKKINSQIQNVKINMNIR